MVARQYPTMKMGPSVTVLQLDTKFPRIPGDVASSQTYIGEVEILRIPEASVGQVVSADPTTIPIAPFEEALAKAAGDIIVTSCGFLSYWQTHLEKQTDKPFISSALIALPELCRRYAPQDILTLTFDDQSLNESHFGPHQTDVVGLSPDMHLRQVISQNRSDLDVAFAQQEIADFVTLQRKPNYKHILLECTNLPPYKDAIADQINLPVTDILTCIEDARPGTVRPKFLGSR
jgi:hypothetical protein